MEAEVQVKKGQHLQSDGKKCAKAANLLYVTDKALGIKRVKKIKKFIYLYNNKIILDTTILNRIKKLVIPPAWENVWICYNEDGHIQATGIDAKNRKQYRYHTGWNALRNQLKFTRLLSFGEKLPLLRLQLEQDLARKELCVEKVLATVIGLMERTYIRVGNAEYEKNYGSYGLTTLKDEHVKIKNDGIKFSFIGKKGIAHKILLNNKKLAKIVKQCREIPGKALFQYYDDQGLPHSIDSGMVNRYIQEVTNEEFTTKDFRTWAGTLNALRIFKKLEMDASLNDRKKKIIMALDFVSKKLGNTRTVCKKYYIHPVIFEMYESETLLKYINQLNNIEKNDNLTGWTSDEIVLMKILRTNHKKHNQSLKSN